jgi:hypothetical protein
MMNKTLCLLTFGVSVAIISPTATAQNPLNPYYTHYCRTFPDECRYYPGSTPRADWAQVETRAKLSQAPLGDGRRIDEFAVFEQEIGSPSWNYFSLGSEGKTGTQCRALDLPGNLIPGTVLSRATNWIEANVSSCGSNTPFPGQQVVYGNWTFSDILTFNTPLRRKAFDGSEYDASPMIQRRNGQPWLTLYWGYKLGLVESRFDWDATALSALPEFKNWPRYALKSEEIMLVKLPPPIIEGEVTEYVNTENFPNDPGGHYYYASNDETRAILDSGRPGKWVRTGKGFKHGGYVSVCRFYGSMSPGPNSHFYTASENECSVLKSIETKPTPIDSQQFNFEGIAFYANVPIPAKIVGQPATCPTQSIPLYRAYNGARGPTGKKNYDSNHRFSTSRADIDAVVAKGWNDEGMVMCVPQ